MILQENMGSNKKSGHPEEMWDVNPLSENGQSYFYVQTQSSPPSTSLIISSSGVVVGVGVLLGRRHLVLG